MYRSWVNTQLCSVLLVSDGKFVRNVTFSKFNNINTAINDEDDILRECRKQMSAYFERRLRKFDIPILQACDSFLTDFQRSVLQHVEDISYGTVITYKGLAEKVGNPNAFRAVGSALSRNSLPIIVPCHRIVASNNIGGFAFGISTKTWLLAHEGVYVS